MSTRLDLVGMSSVVADALHPLAAAAADGDDALVAGIARVLAVDDVAALGQLDGVDGGVEVELDLILEVVVEVLEHDVVDVRAEVTDGGVEQV